jgi:hypothetical protein
VVAVGALAGCGASSTAATVAASGTAATVAAPPGATHAVTATRSGTSRSAAGVAIDRRIAGDVQLRRSDFPFGWTVGPRPAATDGTCPSIQAAKAAVSAHARSREFAQASGDVATATADNAVYIYADTAAARHWFALMSSRGTRECIARVLRKSTSAQVRAQGGTIDSVTASRVSIAPAGDQQSADRIVVRVTAGGFKGKAEADVVFVQAGRGLIAFVLGQVGGPPDPRFEAKLVQAVTDRLAADLERAG